MGRIFGNYILEERIGAGGMGEVYRAIKGGPEGFEARVALKLILPNLAREASFRKLFSREARLAALLKHPNIVNVSGFDILDGTPFIEMEYIEGTDLANLMKQLGGGQILPMEESVHIIYHAARGLAHAHSFGEGSDVSIGIVHRDFNPHNLLISIEGEVKITDFGIARAVLGSTAGSGTLMGKLAYMSPEQIEGKRLDHRSDLFGLGITAYQLLSGRHPFQRAGEAGTVRAVQEASHRPLSEIAASLPPSITENVESLLSVSPEGRPDNAGSVAEVFEEYLRPAAAKNLGGRVRVFNKNLLQEEGGNETAPTLPARSAKPLAWALAMTILAAAVLITFWQTGKPFLKRGGPLQDYNPVNIVSTQEDNPSVDQINPDPISVRVATSPAGARVRDGDMVLGHTPLSVTIPAGAQSRELTIVMDRYEPVRILLTRDKADTGVALTLNPLPTGKIRIGAIPWARVSYMGEDMGVTPVVIEGIPVGTQSLVMSNDELDIQREMNVTVRKGLNPVVVVDMATGKVVRGK